MQPPRIAQKCLSRVATKEEREDRLGDLEEAFHRNIGRQGLAAARRIYAKEAALCILFMIRRRVIRAILFGGQDMIRIFLWAIVSVFVILFIFGVAGGAVPILVQPFEWAIILLTMFGFALSSNRLAGWEEILQDLRRADHRNKSTLPHLQNILEFAQSASEADSLIGGSIALTRDRSAHQLHIVKATMTDAYIGAAIAFTLGVIHAFVHWEDPPEVYGHLMSGACCAIFSGLVVAHAVIGPIAGRLSNLYGEDIREMEATRASLKSEDRKAAFETLVGPKHLSGARYPARLSLFLGLPVFAGLLCLIALMPVENIIAKLGLGPAEAQGRVFYDLPSRSLNLDGPGQPILDFRLSLILDGGPIKPKVTTIDSHMPEILDAVQMQVRQMKPEDFRGNEKLAQMRQVLQGRINEIIKPAQIDGVLFKEVVMH